MIEVLGWNQGNVHQHDIADELEAEELFIIPCELVKLYCGGDGKEAYDGHAKDYRSSGEEGETFCVVVQRIFFQEDG